MSSIKVLTGMFAHDARLILHALLLHRTRQNYKSGIIGDGRKRLVFLRTHIRITFFFHHTERTGSRQHKSRDGYTQQQYICN